MPTRYGSPDATTRTSPHRQPPVNRSMLRLLQIKRREWIRHLGGNPRCTQPRTIGGTVGVRKDASTLSAQECSRFTDAVRQIKAAGVYDAFVAEHRAAMPPMGSGGMTMKKMAHRNAWFLPWHRDFLARVEAELQKVDARVTIPYWNWVRDRTKTSPIWGLALLGVDGESSDGHVTTGPFAAGKWTITVQSDQETDPALRRTLGRARHGDGRLYRLPSKAVVTKALTRQPYDEAPWKDVPSRVPADTFRPQLEHAGHDPVHMWVGGTMELATSPTDPV